MKSSGVRRHDSTALGHLGAPPTAARAGAWGDNSRSARRTVGRQLPSDRMQLQWGVGGNRQTEGPHARDRKGAAQGGPGGHPATPEFAALAGALAGDPPPAGAHAGRTAHLGFDRTVALYCRPSTLYTMPFTRST
jgi:hypothetical protein